MLHVNAMPLVSVTAWFVIKVWMQLGFEEPRPEVLVDLRFEDGDDSGAMQETMHGQHVLAHGPLVGNACTALHIDYTTNMTRMTCSSSG
jgi:hypothetical protein